MTEHVKIETKGFWERPSDYSAEPYVITRALIEDGRNHLVLGGLIETGCPVRILQGAQDPDVPWQHAVELSSRLPLTSPPRSGQDDDWSRPLALMRASAIP